MAGSKEIDKLAGLLAEALSVQPSDSETEDTGSPNDADSLRQRLAELLQACDNRELKAIADQIAVLMSFDPTDPSDSSD